jgi:hypothetical protein
MRTAYKLKLPHQPRQKLTKKLSLKDRRKKKKQQTNTTQQPGKTMTELLLKYQHQDWMLDKEHQNSN